MQKYVLVNFIEKVEHGAEFPATNWPLHVTVASNFRVSCDVEELSKMLATLLGAKQRFTTVADSRVNFGPNQEIPVTVLKMTAELKQLHADTIDLLQSIDAVFDQPQYLYDGYSAHATVQKSARLNPGEAVQFDALTLVDMFPGGDSMQRKVLKTFTLA